MSKVNLEIGGFVPVPDVLIQKFGFFTAGVYGKIWRYEQMDDEVCRAAISTLADDLGVSYNTILNHITKLLEAGYIHDLTPDLKNRPHIYKTTEKLQFALTVVENSTPQILQSKNSRVLLKNSIAHSSNFADESDSFNRLLETDVGGAATAALISQAGFYDDNRKVEKLYQQVTGQPSMPASSMNGARHNAQAVLDYFQGDLDKAVNHCRPIFRVWCSTQGKTGKRYSPLNPAWLEKAMEALAPVPDKINLTPEEQIAKDFSEMRLNPLQR